MSEFYNKISTTRITEWVSLCPEQLSKMRIEIMSFLIWKMNQFWQSVITDWLLYSWLPFSMENSAWVSIISSQNEWFKFKHKKKFNQLNLFH